MPDAPLSRDSIPANLMVAKQAAVARLLEGTGPVSRVATFAATSDPKQNVVGVGIGGKIVDGRATPTPAIRIYVARKLPKGAVPESFLLPEAIEGVPTDVIESGRFRAFLAVVPALPAAVIQPQQRLRPAQPGCSIGFQFPPPDAGVVMAGTFGAVVNSVGGADGTRFILSNNHVLANENALPLGSSIFQPGLLDGGQAADVDQVARLTRFIPIDAGQLNTVDCAIAEVLDPGFVDATVLPKVGRLKSAAAIAAVEDMTVHKVGRTTGYTRGTVFDVSADVTVGYELLGGVRFQNQVLVRGASGSFSAAGDSGSLIVDRATNRPTALLFAGSDAFTIGNHIEDVLNALGVVIVR
jgi:hypothetical protein